MKTLAIFGLLAFGSIVASANTFYVDLNGSHQHPFNTLAKAATNIHGAVAATVSGDLVLIGDGEYVLSTAVSITNDIRIESINGLGAVTLNGGGSVPCFILADVACVISGLTITNGYHAMDDGGGVHCASLKPVITNCILTGNTTAHSGGAISGGTVFNSVITSNSAASECGGLFESIVYNSTISSNVAVDLGGGLGYGRAHNCIIMGNFTSDESGGMESGEAVNCLFWGNKTSLDGGGASWSTLTNCTVVGNHADGSGGGVNFCGVYNSIVIANTSISDEADIYAPDETFFTCSPDASHGIDGNITNSPVFMDAAAGNYRLQNGSPGIDAGSNTYVDPQQPDLAGNVRIWNGLVDMGAYEVHVTSTDTDGDGMEDSWEVQYFGHITNALPHTNPGDSDSFSNYEEFVAGTDPTNSESFFAITNWSGGSFVVEWPSVAGREYTVFWTTNLPSGFVPLAPAVEFPRSSYTDTTHSAESAGFYKVQVELK